MKEVISQSEWIGKIITCQTCNRSYQIEAGDVILPSVSGNSRRGRFDYPKRFNMLCGHYWALPVPWRSTMPPVF